MKVCLGNPDSKLDSHRLQRAVNLEYLNLLDV